ncbi:UNVERIFIED_CONTAM: protein TIFY 6B [Sesamum angustifolium]|uniref:Protein TIFY n=1 Tax=Sesamum angustifolium TaxID=2727405 RepID=A0AAW2QAD0_9LAMI
MERDFMGLAVKQEVLDEPIDAAPVRSLPMQWSFPNKVSALPQLLSFQEEKPKTGFDSLALTGLVTITTTDSEHKSYSGVVQKNIVPENQNGVRYTVSTYPMKHLDSRTIHHPVTSPTNLTVLPAINAAVHQSFVATAGQNLICSVNTQPLGGVLTSNHVPAMPSSSPVVGTTDLRNASKSSGAPAQLTIFYNGSVCVYDNISPDKAQAIMLLAGNGPPATSSITVPAVPVQASMPKTSVLDGFVVSQPYGGLLVSSNKVEPLKVVNSQAPASSNFLPSGTVPQFRRKSLARFLEKRKERVINAMPYATKRNPDCSTTGAGSPTLSVNSSGSCLCQPSNDGRARLQ